MYFTSIPFLYYHLTLKLWLLGNWYYSKGHKSQSHWMSQLKSKNLVPFSVQKLCYYFAAVSKNPKACCLSCKIPIFTGLHLGVVTPILGNPFCPIDTNPSLELFVLMSIMRSRQICLENFTFFNQILIYFSVTGGSWETLNTTSVLLLWTL